MQLLIFIIGLAAVIIPEKFSGQDTVGWVFIAVAVILTLIQFLLFGLILKKMD